MGGMELIIEAAAAPAGMSGDNMERYELWHM